MRHLGIDYGSKRVGVAISDEAGGIAFPRGTLQNDEKLLPELMHLIAAEKIGRIIVGDTRALSGAGNRVTPESDAFVDVLSETAGVPVERAFEAWSSMEAARYAPKGKGHDDASAAAIILQRFLDMHGGAEGID